MTVVERHSERTCVCVCVCVCVRAFDHPSCVWCHSQTRRMPRPVLTLGTHSMTPVPLPSTLANSADRRRIYCFIIEKRNLLAYLLLNPPPPPIQNQKHENHLWQRREHGGRPVNDVSEGVCLGSDGHLLPSIFGQDFASSVAQDQSWICFDAVFATQ